MFVGYQITNMPEYRDQLFYSIETLPSGYIEFQSLFRSEVSMHNPVGFALYGSTIIHRNLEHFPKNKQEAFLLYVNPIVIARKT